jgi:uncharacterized protein YuzE
MKIKYDPEVDALYIRLSEGEILDSDQLHPGVIVDYDEDDNVVGIEVLHAKKRNPPINFHQIELDVGEAAEHWRFAKGLPVAVRS